MALSTISLGAKALEADLAEKSSLWEFKKYKAADNELLAAQGELKEAEGEEIVKEVEEKVNEAHNKAEKARESYVTAKKAAHRLWLELRGMETPSCIGQLMREAEDLPWEFVCTDEDKLRVFYAVFKYAPAYKGYLVIPADSKVDDFFAKARVLKLPTIILENSNSMILANWVELDPRPPLPPPPPTPPPPQQDHLPPSPPQQHALPALPPPQPQQHPLLPPPLQPLQHQLPLQQSPPQQQPESPFESPSTLRRKYDHQVYLANFDSYMKRKD